VPLGAASFLFGCVAVGGDVVVMPCFCDAPCFVVVVEACLPEGKQQLQFHKNTLKVPQKQGRQYHHSNIPTTTTTQGSHNHQTTTTNHE
jgi:hypothetical protein